MVDFVNPTRGRKINGKVNKLNADKRLPLIFRLYLIKNFLRIILFFKRIRFHK